MSASNDAIASSSEAEQAQRIEESILEQKAAIEAEYEAPKSLQNRLMGTLFASQSVFSAAAVVSFTVLPIAAVAITGNEALAGLPSTVTLVARTLVAWPIGWIMDKLGRRTGISLGFGASVIGLALSAWAILTGSFLLFLVGAFINGLGRGTSEQTRYAAADIVVPGRAANAIATLVFAGTIGSVLGPFLNTPAQQAAAGRGLDPLAGPFIIGALITLIALAIVFLFLRPDPSSLSRKREAAVPAILQPARSLRELFSSSVVQLAVVALAISQLVMVMIMVITPLHMSHENHSTHAIEWVISAHVLGMFAFSNVTGRLVQKYGAYLVIAAGGGILVAAAILAPLAHTAWLLGVALFLLGLGWNFGFVAGSSLLAASFTGPEKGQAQGAAETLVAAASAIGSFAIGPSFQWGGYLAVSMIGLAASLCMLGVLFWQRRSQSAVAV